MSGDRIDYSIERRRHEKFVGRAELLARLDQLLVDSETDKWAVITGGPGMGRARCSQRGWPGARSTGPTAIVAGDSGGGIWILD